MKYYKYTEFNDNDNPEFVLSEKDILDIYFPHWCKLDIICHLMRSKSASMIGSWSIGPLKLKDQYNVDFSCHEICIDWGIPNL